MEISAKIAVKRQVIGDTSKSASHIAVRAPAPGQDMTWINPLLRPADPNAANVEVVVEPIVRKRYQEILYFDGRDPLLVSESVTAVIN